MKKKSKLSEKPARIPEIREQNWGKAIPEYLQSVKSQVSESAKSHLFLLLLKELFGIQPGFIEDYISGIEKFIKVKQKDRILKGEVDNLFGNLIKDFGIKSHAFQVASQALLSLWRCLKEKPDFKVVYESWEKYLQIVYGTGVAEEELFCRHTYLASLAKLMASSRLSEGKLDNSQIISVLSGQFFKSSQNPHLAMDKSITSALFHICEVLKYFIEAQRDTIWAFVLKNIYMLHCSQQTFYHLDTLIIALLSFPLNHQEIATDCSMQRRQGIGDFIILPNGLRKQRKNGKREGVQRQKE
ncbi:MAG: hypothetical protein AB1595_01965 [bacterium]